MTDTTTRRVALVADACHYVGPEMSRMLAHRGHDLVLGDPEPTLIAELEALGSTVVAVERVSNIAKPENSQKLVDAALDRFGRFDAAVAASGQIIPGSFLDSTIDQYEKIVDGCLYAVPLPQGRDTAAGRARFGPGARHYECRWCTPNTWGFAVFIGASWSNHAHPKCRW